jgi:hypothetical protein
MKLRRIDAMLSTYDCLLAFGPLLVFVVIMAILSMACGEKELDH